MSHECESCGADVREEPSFPDALRNLGASPGDQPSSAAMHEATDGVPRNRMCGPCAAESYMEAQKIERRED